ncbi:hypothetical protein CesoFtcFv8_009284 [Champsocephalus esox]|uniref:Uncharacterized protein n=1 Tax=Champsocephalus esox TaxID=159716 RepID=A0AAN8CAA7_9TELE|nr:hypothetical protein CesoFtcFv8_009284 [Champsocephalus esox]
MSFGPGSRGVEVVDGREGEPFMAYIQPPHCCPLFTASSRGHPPPSFLHHLHPEAPVHAPPAWVIAKEDTWQRTDRPKAAWTPSDPAEGRKKIECVFVSK